MPTEIAPRNTQNASDVWSEWLLHRRHGGHPKYEPVMRALVEGFRDRVLDGANLAPGMVLVDVGAGDGLIAFGAFERLGRLGRDLRAVLVDPSVPLLERAERRAAELGLGERCSFLNTSAEELRGVADASADLVTSRAVLAYVADKAKALRQFYRVLKPGGRISLGEPILRDEAVQLANLTRYLQNKPHAAATATAWLIRRWKAAQYPSTAEEIDGNPLTNFTERDLFEMCRLAGFHEIQLELHIKDRPSSIKSLEVLMDISPRPGAPTLREIFASDFTPEERRQLEDALRAQFASKFLYERDIVAYIVAIKPP